MLEQENVLVYLKVIMTKFQTSTSTLSEQVLLQVVLIRHAVFIMFRPLPAQEFWRDMKVKFRKLFSIHKETKYYLQDSIKQQGFGMLKQAANCKFQKVTRMKSFLACLTMKVTLLLQAQKITLAKFGEILKSIRKSEQH